MEIGNIAQIQETPGYFTRWTAIGALVEVAMAVRFANYDLQIQILFMFYLG